MNKPKLTVLQRLGEWFLTETGKKFVFGSAVATSITIVSGYMIPQTILLDQLKDVVHLYKNGFTVPLPPQIRQRFDKTLNLLQIPEQEQKRYKPFMVFGFDIFSAGASFSRYGVIVGMPVNFTYIDSSVIDKQSIRIIDQSVIWELDEAKLLLKSLTLSENAQMYAMAREIELRKTSKFFADTFGAVSSFICAYATGNHLNTKLNLFSRSRDIRFILYALVGSFFGFNYLFIKDACQLYYEKKIDEHLKGRDPIFKEGGKEFYENIINRNIALRKLMGKVGESKFTALGNENYFIRQRHLPLIQRKATFEGEVESA